MLVCWTFLLCINTGFAQIKPVNRVIFDSDMGPDYDDVGAITMLHAFADRGDIKILATVASTSYKDVAGVFSIFNTYFKRPYIPIGIPKKNGLILRDWQHWSDSILLNYPHSIKANEEVPDAVEVYRKILAGVPDKSVTIITVGFFTNLSQLLKSGADKYSKLDGQSLVSKKVKLLVSMAGKYPSGREFNISQDASSSQFVFNHWKTPVIFTGFEIGSKIKVGLPLIHNKQIKYSPVKDVFRISIPKAAEDSIGRMSWDETAVLIAAKGYKPFYSLHYGKIIINEDGSNYWIDGGRDEAYVVENTSHLIVQDLINKMIMHQPMTVIKK